LINRKANACPMAVRVAWHSSGTFDKSDSSGGSNGGTMRFEPEITDDANAGLSIIQDMLLRVKKEHPEISYGDIWTLAGAQAVEFLGGPKVPHTICRTDRTSGVPENGRLPDASQGAAHLRDVFYRMGFNDQEIVALSGAHTLGRCHLARSGYDGPWTTKPLNFDNEYFVNLLNRTWRKSSRTGPNGPMQYEDAETSTLMMLPTDIALRDDPAFRPHVERYARDEQVFFDEFASAFAKLLALGTPPAGCPAAAAAKTSTSSTSSSAHSADHSAEFREQAMHGSLAKVTELAPKADVQSIEVGSGRTALHKAAFWGHDHLMDLLLNTLKVNTDVQDYNGDTALHDAARFGHAGVVKHLVDARANTQAKNREGQTPLDVAIEYAKPKVIAVLRGGSGIIPSKL